MQVTRSGARAALLASLVLFWLNYLLTARWAHVPGSIHGAKQPFFVLALLAVSVLACRASRRPEPPTTVARAVCVAGLVMLSVAFLCWFPPHTWTLLPFLDDWPPRFQSTVEGVRQLRHLAFSGWRWHFLGGYPMATDVTQDLTFWAAIPMLLFGDTIGFHLAHLLLFALVPLVVWWDASLEPGHDRAVPLLAAGLAAAFAANYSYFLIRSGDTNSLAGAVSTLLALSAAHGARAGRRWAARLYPLALTAVFYSHRGFFAYACGLLILDAVMAWDAASARRCAIAMLTALVAGLPVTWDLWRYPAYFISNNVELHPAPLDLIAYARKIYYNVELLVRPGRWFNDYTGLTNAFLPVVVYAAWRGRGRARFNAAAVLAVVAVVRLSYGGFGYIFDRPIHLLPLLMAPLLGWFVVQALGDRVLAGALGALCLLYIQIAWAPVPHVRGMQDVDASLAGQVAAAPGALVAVEDGFHRDADSRPDRVSVPTPFPAHFEAYLARDTGRRLYAGLWDGWQWTPYRDQVLANGTFRGETLADVDPRALEAELRRWGIRTVFVWSDPAKSYFRRLPAFSGVWRSTPWEAFAFASSDGRSVTVTRGSATLGSVSEAGGSVRLENVHAGDAVVVRTNYHPALMAILDGQTLALTNQNGQLAFEAPRDGTYDVALTYPARRWLTGLAILGLVMGAVLADRIPSGPVR